MKKNMIIAIFGVLVLVAIGFVVARSTKQEENTLTVGMMSGWAPFMSINNNGEYEGFDVDCAQELAQRMNKKLVIKDMGAVASCFIALEQRKVDLVLSGLDITQARLDSVAMVRYTGEDEKVFSLVFWDEIPSAIQSMEDFRQLPDAVVCVESGSAQQAFLDQYSFITKKCMNGVIDIILDLRFGKSIAAILEPRIARRFAVQNPQLKMIDVPLPKECIVYGSGIAIKKDNTAMIDAIANTIASMKADGFLTALEVRWQLERQS